MKISKQELIELNACQSGLQRFIDQTNNTDESVEVLNLIGGKNTTGDLLWLAGKKLPKESIVKFTCNCALINIEKIKPYTDKYELIVDFLNNPNAVAAAAYYATADATADAVAAAADAVAAAAYADAADAADAAYYATATADAAYYATADADAIAAYAADAAYAAYAADAAYAVNKLLVELFSEEIYA